MHYTFRVTDRSKSPTDNYLGFLNDLTTLLDDTKPISDEGSYNKLLKSIDTLIHGHRKLFTEHSQTFSTEIEQITAKKSLTEETPWGGVSLKKVDVENDYIQKLLVIKQYGILGFEIHQFKHEHLRVVDGLCLLIHSVHADTGWEKGTVSLSLAQAGDTITLLPGDEHGVIALTNCVLEETSTNHLDDLIFLFNSHQIESHG